MTVRGLARAAASALVQWLEPRRLMASGGVSVAAGDLDGDGFADLAIIHRDLATRNILLTTHVNDRKSGPGPTRASVSLTEAEYNGIAIGDVNRDGRPDVVITICHPRGIGVGPGAPGPHVKVFAGNGAGGFATDAIGAPISREFPMPAGTTHINSVAVGDVDGDGGADIAVNYETEPPRPREAGSAQSNGRYASLSLGMFWSNEAGARPTFAVLFPSDPDANCGDSLAIADVDGDAEPDVVAYPRELNLNQPPELQPDVVVLRGKMRDQKPDAADVSAEAAFVQLNHHGSTTSSNQRYQTLTVLGAGDLDGDGRAELIGLASGDAGSDVYATNFRAKVLPHIWTDPIFIRNAGGETPESSVTSALADFDGDGRLDIVSYSDESELWSFGKTITDGPSLVWSPRSNIDLYGMVRL